MSWVKIMKLISCRRGRLLGSPQSKPCVYLSLTRDPRILSPPPTLGTVQYKVNISAVKHTLERQIIKQQRVYYLMYWWMDAETIYSVIVQHIWVIFVFYSLSGIRKNESSTMHFNVENKTCLYMLLTMDEREFKCQLI